MTAFFKGKGVSQVDEILIESNRYSEADLKAIIIKYKIKPIKESK